ncbi:hypothetical protein, conserved [Trypanosoma brucei brucei TREU927]|uniref:Uncharacterized protein n=1 Tax=Trypanosoma brucei brucei (strain 927/4 GUTat10.1) TaxID=185431 RepID=Q385A9_TRYB2|nr:hypothetical protein, conserved [Trypanosoma brucei brucei TREU927]EAN79622.1 hypothetical protein, conserved [Trypanosoma brucei brucei TREU927]
MDPRNPALTEHSLDNAAGQPCDGWISHGVWLSGPPSESITDRMLTGPSDMRNDNAAPGMRRAPPHLFISTARQPGCDEVCHNMLQDGSDPLSMKTRGYSPLMESNVHSVPPSFGGSSASSPTKSSMTYSPYAGAMTASPFLSISTPVISPGVSEGNGVSFQRSTPPSLPVGLSTFVASQGNSNFVMVTQPNTPHTLYVQGSCPAPGGVPHYVVAQPQLSMDVCGGMTYVPMTPAQQTFGTVMGDQLTAVTPGPNSAAPFSPTVTCFPVSVSSSSPLGNGLLQPSTPMNSSPLAAACAAAGVGSPPSYDSHQVQQSGRKAAAGHQRSSVNVHGTLQGFCLYHSYNISNTISRYGQTDTVSKEDAGRTLLVFFQMFPCELRQRAVVVLNRVLEVVCGDGMAVAESVEWRSETSFIARVRTKDIWTLIYQVRCRVLMDRHGFWYAADREQYSHLRKYCERVRNLPQQTRHSETDGLPCMPLIVELSRGELNPPPRPPTVPDSFDCSEPMMTVDRRSRTAVPTAAEFGRCGISA